MSETTDTTPKRTRRARALAVLGLAAAAVYAAPLLTELGTAHASGGGGFFGFGGGSGGGSGGGMGGGSGVIQAATDPTAAKECGACHMAYAPRYLPAGSWSQMIGNLENHFGEDAWLPEEAAQQVGAYYVNNAGGQGTGALRITETRWWVGEHRGEVSQWDLDRNAKGTPANCDGCHQIMGQGTWGNNQRQWNNNW